MKDITVRFFFAQFDNENEKNFICFSSYVSYLREKLCNSQFSLYRVIQKTCVMQREA